MKWSDAWPSIDSIFGWLSQAEARKLYDLAGSLPPNTDIVELGAFMGRSTAALAFGIIACNRLDMRVISIDTWQGSLGGEEEVLCKRIMAEHGVSDLYELHGKNLARLGLEAWSRRIRGTTVPHGLEWTKEWGVTPGLVFIDADHNYAGVKADFEGFAPLVPVGGTIAFHDSWAPGPSQVISEMGPGYERSDAEAIAAFRKVRT